MYSWPVALLKDLEKCIRNFIWSGDKDKRKLVTVSWEKICRSYNQGGLNIRSLTKMNLASNLHLCWKLFNSQSSWAILLRDRVVRGSTTIQHHIFSSIWCSVKEEVSVLKDNCTWLLGDGKDINFWNDRRCGPPLSDQLSIPAHICQSLKASVSDFIVEGNWVIPSQLSNAYPNLYSIISQITIPLVAAKDKLLWKLTDDGELSLKEAYLFKIQQIHELPWAKCIWSPDIPPSKSLLAWRLMHSKVPTDENLMARGCYIPSMCNLCNNHIETSFHIFFECPFAVRLWSWLAGCLNKALQFTSMEDMWRICEWQWSPQCKITVTAAIVNLLNTIWLARNQVRYNNKLISWRNAISIIIACTTLSGNKTLKASSNSMSDFTFLKIFRIDIHHPRIPVIKEVIWQPPSVNWIKCNTDGASCGNPGIAACGGVFRDHHANFVYAFAEPLGVETAYFAELCGVLKAIEIAYEKNWANLWVESDSSQVVAAFKNPKNSIAWPLRNRWKNAIFKMSHMHCIVTHTYREGNKVADLIANFGLSSSEPTFWNVGPEFILDAMDCNKRGLPNFRLCSS
jgi:ribonuclease HI